MQESGTPNLRRVTRAAVAASLMTLGLGLAHHVVAARLTASTSVPSIAPGTLKQLPMRIGEWSGEDVPLDDAIVRRTDTDAHINRRYSRGATELVSAYVACGVRIRDMMAHRPEVCYIGAGWTRTGRHAQDLLVSNGVTLPCTIFEFSRGVLHTTKVAVLYYYIVDGECCRTLRYWQYHFWDVGYVAQVHIVVSSDERAIDESMRIASCFAAESAPLIMRVLDDLAEDPKGESSVVRPELK